MRDGPRDVTEKISTKYFLRSLSTFLIDQKYLLRKDILRRYEQRKESFFAIFPRRNFNVER